MDPALCLMAFSREERKGERPRVVLWLDSGVVELWAEDDPQEEAADALDMCKLCPEPEPKP